jgi:MFS family permease
VVQAAGAAMLQANSVALVATSAPPTKRRAALGIQAAAQALGLALGPVVGGLLVASAGWQWIFFVNVPVGMIAVLAGWFLLPRTRQLADGRDSDPLGMTLLALAAVSMLVAVSTLSGLGLPPLALAGSAAAAALATAGLIWRERRAAAPLIDLPLLAAAGIAPALGGALFVYMVLFGPLVLLPQTLAADGDSALRAGLLLTALPTGFGLAAVAAERVLPARWPNRRRCVAGGLLATCSMAALAIPAPVAVTVVSLALLGTGLGAYIPANNTQIMTAVQVRDAATAGGMVNMTRGLGTALGVAVVALGLHAGTNPGHADGGRLAIAALAAAALAATWAGTRPVISHPGVTGQEATDEPCDHG